MTREKLNGLGWILFGLGVVMLSFSNKPGVIVMVLACACFFVARRGKR